MNALTLKHLRYFHALAEHGHFGRAAQACSISQPALSVQIKELEQILGAALVERNGRQILLTSLGYEFAERAGKILRQVDEVGTLARASGDEMAGRFRIGIIPTIAPYLLPAFMTKMAQIYPRIDITIRETVTPNLEEAVRNGALDAAILALPIAEPSFSEVRLFSEPFLLVRPTSDADTPVPDGRSLQKMKLLLLEEGHCFRDQALSFCGVGRSDASRTRDIMDASSLSTLVQMVAAGIGVTLIPEMAASVEARSAPVALARFAEPAPSRNIGMIWRKTNPVEKQLMRLSSVVRDAALDLRKQR